MAKSRKTRRSRFEGINLDTLNQEAAKVTNQEIEKVAEEKSTATRGIKKETSTKEVDKVKLVEEPNTPKRKKGRPKSSNRKPLNTAIEPKNRQRLEFLAMLNGGSVADQLNNILSKYFTEIEQVDELIEIFEERKKKR